MRIVMIIAMIIGFLVSGALGLLPISMDAHLKKVDPASIEQMEASIAQMEEAAAAAEGEAKASIQEDIDKAEEALDQIPGSGRVGVTTALAYLTSLLALVFIITVFMKKEALSTKLGIGLAIIGIFTWILCPSLEAGEYGPVNPKTIALIGVVGLLVSVGAGITSYKFLRIKSE